MYRVSSSITIGALLFAGFAAAQNPAPSSPSASAPGSSFAGCIQKSGGVYTLTDEQSNTTVELRGSGLHTGRHVRITGTPAQGATPPAGASQVIDVTGLTRIEGSCKASLPNSGKSFMSRSRTTIVSVAIIGAVAALGAWAVIDRQGAARGQTPPPHTGYFLAVRGTR